MTETLINVLNISMHEVYYLFILTLEQLELYLKFKEKSKMPSKTVLFVSNT